MSSDTDLVLWLPEGQHSNVRAQFCPLANLFCNAEHLAAWKTSAGESTGRRLTLAKAAELGRAWWGQLANSCDPPPLK